MNKYTKYALFGTLILGAVGAGVYYTKQNTAEEVAYAMTEKVEVDRPMDNQTESSYWFPNELLEWDFSKDPNAKYNVSTVPLAKRVDKKELAKVNETQDENMKVVALSIMNSSTSGNVPYGSNTFDANVFSYWQYIDELVYWGGSSGEGIIVPPSPDVIDAAHKNGVPVLGTIFFPQTAHGGKIEWLDEFLVQDKDGKFPMVDKLVEVATQYGFDGWFINQETDNEVESFDDVANGVAKKESKPAEEQLTKEHAQKMEAFIKQLKEASNDHTVMWYDSMTSDGKMDWQNALTEQNKSYLVDANMEPVADEMFLNFWWNTEKLGPKELLKSSEKLAKENNIDPYDLYAGIDVQADGYMTPVDWQLFTDENNRPYTSLGLYAPNWTYSEANGPEDFQSKESIFWVNGEGDPTKSTVKKDSTWPGISTYAVEQTAITQAPFVTNFNLGNGYNYFIDGQKVSEAHWNNRGLQDIMPTYRYIMDQGEGNDLKISIDYADAYQGGNSLKLRGNIEAKQTNTLKLYQMQVPIEKKMTLTTTAKASEATTLALQVTFDDGQKETIAGNHQVGDMWTTVEYDLSSYVGKTIQTLSYEITSEKSSDTYELRLGQLALLPKNEKNLAKIADAAIEEAIFDEEESNYAGVRMTWDVQNAERINKYEIYRINQDGTKTFLQATPAKNAYLNGLKRNDDTNKTDFEIVAVDYFGQRSKASTPLTLDWPDTREPKAAFTADKTLIAPGETVTFENRSSSNTDSLNWTFEGGSVKESTDENPTVTYDKAGEYKVTLTAKNKMGEANETQEKYIVVTDKAKDGVPLVSQNVKTEASSFVNDGEAPEFAVDGKDDTKWCATGAAPHDITLDLGKDVLVSQVVLKNAEADGEGADMNTKAFTIETSTDGKTFTPVSRTISNEDAVATSHFAPQTARYVRIVIDKPTQGSDSAARIYGIEVYGL